MLQPQASNLAGDGSFRKESSKSFVNSGLIYSYRYPIFLILKIFDPGIQKLLPIFFHSYFPKTGNKIGVCELNFFSIINFNHFFTTTKYAQIKKFIQSLQHQKVVKINFRKKVYLTNPYYFCQFWGEGKYTIFLINKKLAKLRIKIDLF